MPKYKPSVFDRVKLSKPPLPLDPQYIVIGVFYPTKTVRLSPILDGIFMHFGEVETRKWKDLILIQAATA